MKLAPMPWILCGPGAPPFRIAESFGSMATIWTSGLAFLQDLADAGDGSAGADAGDEDVHLAVGVGPDFLGRGGAVDLRVGFVGELLGPDGVLRVGHDLLGLLHGAAHAFGARGQHDLRTERTQHDTAFRGHGLGHGQDDLVAAGGTHHGQGDAGVAGGSFDDGSAGLERAGLLRGVNNGDADTVLDAVGRVVELELDGHLGVQALGQAVEPDQRSAADKLGDVVVDPCHVFVPISEEFSEQRILRSA